MNLSRGNKTVGRCSYVCVMALVVVLASFCLFSQNTQYANAQVTTTTTDTCAEFKSQLDDGTMSFCAGIIEGDYFLPANATQEDLERQAYNSLVSSSSVATILPLLPSECSKQLKKTICLATFQRCILVDPYFVDSCPPGDCTEDGNTTCSSGTGDSCATDVGTLPGTNGSPWDQAACEAKNLIWFDDESVCRKPTPVSPCRELCNSLHSVNTTVVDDKVFAKCPVVSGYFILAAMAKVEHAWLSTILGSNENLNRSMLPDEEENEFLKQELQTKIDEDFSGNLTTLQTDRTELNLMNLLGALPSCLQTTESEGVEYFLFAEEYTLEREDGLGSVGELIEGKAGAVLVAQSGDETACGEHHTLTCSELINAVKCNSDHNSFYMQPSIAFANELSSKGMQPVCKNVIEAEANQVPTKQEDLITQGVSNRDAAQAFFVNSAIGLPPLPHVSQTTPTQSQPFSFFMNQDKEGGESSSGSPLCSRVTDESGTRLQGSNSLQCQLQEVGIGVAAMPQWVNPTCRFAFHDLVCSAGYPKVEPKTMCLLKESDGPCDPRINDPDAAEGHVLGFSYALPRFPSKSLCQKVNKECGAFIEFLRESGQAASVQKLEALLDCDSEVSISCEDNVDWKSSVWPESACSNPFNGLPAYPAKSQTLADIEAIGGDFFSMYLQSNGIELQSQGESAVLKPTISEQSLEEQFESCECPEPLVVPDNPAKGGASEFTCCDQPCTTSMYTPEEFQLWYDLQLGVCIISALCALFVFLTYTTFKENRNKRLIAWFSVTSFMASMLFVITNAAAGKPEDTWCVDNTTPKFQSDGGLCLFQSIFICFWPLAACGWWWCQAVDLYIRINLNKKHLHLMKYYATISFGIPLVETVAYAASGSFGYTGPNPWCFHNEDVGTALEVGPWYGVIAFYMTTGCFLMLLVLTKIYKISTQAQSISNTKQSAAKRLRMYRTPLLFVAVFLIVWITIFSWRFNLLAREPAIRDSGEAWFSCLLSNFAQGIKNPATNASADISAIAEYREEGEGCGLVFPTRVSNASFIVVQLVALAQGFMIFLVYGARSEAMLLWGKRLGLTSKKVDTDTDNTSSHTGGGGSTKALNRKAGGNNSTLSPITASAGNTPSPQQS